MFSFPALLACPVCDSETGSQVRAGIFNGAFGENLITVLAPFPILLLVVAVLHFFGPGSSRKL